MMEQHHFPRRTVSHGALRSNYSSYGGGAVPSPVRPFHKPLRSVNENSVLLQSPGALESMLKTTTETGDIGIFSIRPVPPSPIRPRDACSEFNNPRSRHRRCVDETYRQNSLRRPPPHGDAISEVLSVYGSDSLKSTTSTHSPNSTEDLGQRSYSMTTCGSRQLSNYRSTTTLQSQGSGHSHLQRPRSPFPYPTRLKRPGVRPVSPAVTEDGQVDYSRMVEINRVSYRTVHGHFKHTYSPIPKRPPPLGLRVDNNRSNPSLAPPGPPPNYRGPPPPMIRAHSPAPIPPWNPHFQEGLDIAPARASNFNSVPNIHRRMPTVPRMGKSFPREPPPRYYDYTEEFESKSPSLASWNRDFLPPHTRAVRYPRPIIIRDDDDHLSASHLGAIFGEGDSAFFDCESQLIDEQEVVPAFTTIPDHFRDCTETPCRSTSCLRQNQAHTQPSTDKLKASEIGVKITRGSDINLLPSQIGRDSGDTFNPNLDFESKDVPLAYRYVACRAATVPKAKTKTRERQVQVLGGRTLTIRSEQGVIFQEDMNHDIVRQGTPDSCLSHTETGNNESQSPDQVREELLEAACENHESGECQNGPAEPEPKASVPSSDDASVIITQHALDLPGPKGPVGLSTSETTQLHIQETENGKTETALRHRGHKRNHAVLGIDTAKISYDSDDDYLRIVPTCSTVPVVSPQPISPARQLKLKNSIPRLMKTLPPLPGTLEYNPLSTLVDVTDEDDFAEILIPMILSKPKEFICVSEKAPTNICSSVGSEGISNKEVDVPKFKLRIKTNSCSEASHENEIMAQQERSQGMKTRTAHGNEETVVRGRNKLKVKSPRRSRLSSSHWSTVRHRPCRETSEIVADLMQQRPRDLFSIPSRSETALSRKRRKPLPEPISRIGDSCYTVDVIPADYSNFRVPSNVSTENNELPAIDKDTLLSSLPSHGLIKRLSNLRSLLASSTRPTPRFRDNDSWMTRKITACALPHANDDGKSLADTTEYTTTGLAQIRLGQRIQARLSGWMRGAKMAMRKCGKRKHNRHRNEGVEQT